MPRRVQQLTQFPESPALPHISNLEDVRTWVGSRPRPWAIDLFAGLGGVSLGLKRAKFSVLYAVDSKELAVESYRENHKDVLSEWADIRSVCASSLRRSLGIEKHQLDLIAGCPPCQGFSSLRTMNGKRTVADPRNDLISDMLRFVVDFRPKAVMLENVPGLADDERFAIFCLELNRLGYKTNTKICNASDYGVPQRRRRLILLAGYNKILPFGSSDKTMRTVRDAIGKIDPPGSTGDPSHDVSENRSERIARLIRAVPKNGGSRSDTPAEFQLKCHAESDGFWDVYGRMAWEKAAPTITSGCVNPSKGRFLHPDEDRCITPREAALLQGFPEEYFVSDRRGKYGAAELIGDALPPELARVHSERIRDWVMTSS